MFRRKRQAHKYRLVYVASSVLIFAIILLLIAKPFFSSQQPPNPTAFLADVTQDYTRQPSPTAANPEPAGSAGIPSVTLSKTVTLGATLIGPATVADGWANAVLDKVLAQFGEGMVETGSGFPWWQSSAAVAQLTFYEEKPFLGQEVLILPSDKSVVLSMPDDQNSDRLQQIGLIRMEGGALILFAYDQESPDNERDWIIGKNDMAIPFHALAVQAAARNTIVRLAVDIDDGIRTEIVIAGIDPYLAIENPPSAGPQTPVLQQSPTPTRIPETAMGRMVANYLDPVLDELPRIQEESVENYVRTHPFSGLLTWTENGPEIGGYGLSVEQAELMTLNSLVPGSTAGEQYTFLTAQYNGSVTRILEVQIYYQEQRMEELVYWAIVRAAEHGGQLRVSYDDFGSRQAITIIGFQVFQQP